MGKTNGRFVWHELSTTNVDAAKTFYPRITRWTTQAYGDTDYTMWVNESTPIAGLMTLTPDLTTRGVPPHWLPYVSVYDVDACARQVGSLGGQLRMGPAEVPNVGAWAVISDPQGAVLGLYEPDKDGPANVEGGRPGDFSWHELMTTDATAAFEFYKALFGWAEAGQSEMDGGIYHMYGIDGQPLVGMFNKSAEMPPPNWVSYIRVGDADAAASTTTAGGGRVVNGPMDIPGGGRIAVCLDPQGVLFAVHAEAGTA